MGIARLAYLTHRSLTRFTKARSRTQGTPRPELLAAASRGDASARYRLGCVYSDGGDIGKDSVTACMWWQLAAEDGNAPAMFKLGEAYLNGDGVPLSRARGFHWMSKAAGRGHSGAALLLAVCFHNGDRLPKSGPNEIKWLKRAANLGCAQSVMLLGGCFRVGIGVEKNLVSGYAHFIGAAIRSKCGLRAVNERMADSGMNEGQMALARELGEKIGRKDWKF